MKNSRIRSRSNHRHTQRTSLIALLTDFGLRDHYVGTMKGVMLTRNPSLRFVDLSHEIHPQAVNEAAYLLWSSYRYFPRRTVFVCVIDPGVGSDRPIHILRTADHIFLAPANGVLDFVTTEEKHTKLFEVDLKKAEKYLHDEISHTFHGRDIFAPLAALLASGVEIARMAKGVALPSACSPFVENPHSESAPQILHIDRFGNVVTNIRLRDERTARQRLNGLAVNEHRIETWIANYSSAESENVSLIIGSDGLVEIVIKNGSAAKVLQTTLSSVITVHWK
ncbi:MAG: SAM-dependent chlorinase/fluorinase [Ignavibacteriales bacterium]|nr:SAM-dependent chlorinase/fluorinase [Ignavibacteriales bacterium]